MYLCILHVHVIAVILTSTVFDIKNHCGYVHADHCDIEMVCVLSHHKISNILHGIAIHNATGIDHTDVLYHHEFVR